MNDKTTDLTTDEKHEIDSAAVTAERTGDPAGDVRGWLQETRAATLCTTSAKPDFTGFPFGSIVPFAVDAEGHPVILIADIAAHTANLKRDPRASLFISDPAASGDPQTSWRVSILGTMTRILPEGSDSRHGAQAQFIAEDEYADIHSRYVERVPAAEGYLKQHSFDYWRMNDIRTARYIAGFGRICWVDGTDVLRDPMAGGLAEAAAPTISHMNEDHPHNLLEMCKGHYGFTPESAEMTALDATGFHVRTHGPERTLFFSFGREIVADDLRVAVIDVLKRARAVTV